MHFEWASAHSTPRHVADKMSGDFFFSVIVHLLNLTAIFLLKFDLQSNYNLFISTIIAPGLLLLDVQDNEV